MAISNSKILLRSSMILLSKKFIISLFKKVVIMNDGKKIDVPNIFRSTSRNYVAFFSFSNYYYQMTLRMYILLVIYSERCVSWAIAIKNLFLKRRRC